VVTVCVATAGLSAPVFVVSSTGVVVAALFCSSAPAALAGDSAVSTGVWLVVVDVAGGVLLSLVLTVPVAPVLVVLVVLVSKTVSELAPLDDA